MRTRKEKGVLSILSIMGTKLEWFTCVCCRKESKDVRRSSETSGKRKRRTPKHRWRDSMGLKWCELQEHEPSDKVVDTM